jgi:hypothetical protein
MPLPKDNTDLFHGMDQCFSIWGSANFADPQLFQRNGIAQTLEAGYARKGMSVFSSSLSGSFAQAVLSRPSGARYRPLGTRPFGYGVLGIAFVFSPMLVAIGAFLEFGSDVDHYAVLGCGHFHMVVAPGAICGGMQRLL